MTIVSTASSNHPLGYKEVKARIRQEHSLKNSTTKTNCINTTVPIRSPRSKFVYFSKTTIATAQATLPTTRYWTEQQTKKNLACCFQFCPFSFLLQNVTFDSCCKQPWPMDQTPFSRGFPLAESAGFSLQDTDISLNTSSFSQFPWNDWKLNVKIAWKES